MSQPGKGLALGNQASQWFALYYLDGLDRLIKEELRVKHYSRYMDDGVIIHSSKEYLRECLKRISQFADTVLRLEFNAKTQISPVSQGVKYLGFHLYLTDSGKVVRKVNADTKVRMRRCMATIGLRYANGEMTLSEVHQRVSSYVAHLSQGNTDALRRDILNRAIFISRSE
ncbi:MAG: RNA-directed DNA polymerase [Propionibacteriaceae bacterium]|jgi:hypothetical protein|nr:RNA-directed DNA polymerase [Propionibacteriaceae bacterium]